MISTESNRTAELTTDGAETEFDFELLIHDDSEIQVWYQVTGGEYTQLTLDTHYTVVFTEDGGTITTIGGSSPYAAGTILIIRHLAITQQTNWLFNDNHTGPQHEDDFDRAVMRDLQIQEQIDRAVGFAITSSTSNIEFPEPVADNIIGWNAGGDALENKVGVTGLIILPPADGNFIVGDGTEFIVESGAIARASLGLTIGTDVLAWQAIGIADDYLLEVDGTPNSGEYARFTANGLEGRTVTENRDDLGLGTGDSPTLTGLTLSGLTETRVLFAGASGVISDDAGFTFASATDILTTGTYNATDEDNVLQIDGITVLRKGTVSNNNLFLGCSVFDSYDGIENIGIGFEAGKNNDTTGGGIKGTKNVYIGYQAGLGPISGNEGVKNLAIGYTALTRNTTGGENFALGSEALSSNTTGDSNVAIGALAMQQNKVGSSNMAIGTGALQRTDNGSDNVGIGFTTGRGAGFGASIYRNIFIGSGVASAWVFGADNNVIIGYSAAKLLTSGDSNVFIGYKAGYRQTINSNLLIIDNQDRSSAAAELTDCLIYGIFSATPASQSIRFNVGTTTWHNATHEDSDGGRKSQLNFKGQQSGGEETTLARIEVGHDGAADDEKGFIDGYTNSGSDGDSPTKQFRIQSTGDWVINKTSGIGIKVDLSAPTFGWRDLLGQPTALNTGASKPTFTTYRDTLLQFQFAAGDEEYFEFHIPHDYVAGTDIHLHIHWSHTSAIVTGGTVTFEYEISYAKGHNQAAFGASVGTTFVGTASTTQYQQIITEVQISATSPDGNQIDSDDLEPDGIIIARFDLNSNDITSSGAVPDPFIHYVDIHYQSTNLATKQKAPDFYT